MGIWVSYPYTLLSLCRWGADLGFLGVDLSPSSDVVMSWFMVEATAGFRLDSTSILDVCKVFWHLDMV
jgi:hypothetical protein